MRRLGASGFSGDHADLSNVTGDQHHRQLTTLDSPDLEQSRSDFVADDSNTSATFNFGNRRTLDGFRLRGNDSGGQPSVQEIRVYGINKGLVETFSVDLDTFFLQEFSHEQIAADRVELSIINKQTASYQYQIDLIPRAL